MIKRSTPLYSSDAHMHKDASTMTPYLPSVEAYQLAVNAQLVEERSATPTGSLIMKAIPCPEAQRRASTPIRDSGGHALFWVFVSMAVVFVAALTLVAAL